MNDLLPVTRIAHVNLRGPAPLVERLRAFYVDVIGLQEGPRPSMLGGHPGHWLYAGDLDVVHLSVDPQTGDPQPPAAQHAGFNHVAFACHGLDGAKQRLRRAGIDYRLDQFDDPPRVQLFVFDPAGTRIELNFAGV